MKNLITLLFLALFGFNVHAQENVTETLLIGIGESLVKLERTLLPFDSLAGNSQLIKEVITPYTLKEEESTLVWKAAYKSGCKVTKDDFFELVAAGLESFVLKLE